MHLVPCSVIAVFQLSNLELKIGTPFFSAAATKKMQQAWFSAAVQVIVSWLAQIMNTLLELML